MKRLLVRSPNFLVKNKFMITETVKINIPSTSDFSKREKHINVEIQKQIDLFNSQGLIVLSHEIANKTNTYASVKFKLKKMVGA